MSVITELKTAILAALNKLYANDVEMDKIVVNTTKPELEGDYTLVLFSLAKHLQKKPEDIGKDVGNILLSRQPKLIANYGVIRGFLNLTIDQAYLKSYLEQECEAVYAPPPTVISKKFVLEYASPNTNKPLHLGHLRNIFLGWSMAEILTQQGNDVVKSCIYNDRGIHICKSMVAWQQFADGRSPQDSNIKGDHLVGYYYVLFGAKHKEQMVSLIDAGMSEKLAEQNTPIMKSAQEMLLKWERGDRAVLELWEEMNGWVYAGFNQTYERVGADFDVNYYESQTYLLGKDMVHQGLKSKVFYEKEDGSVWIDLTAEGLDEKIVLRKDGTSVYITQDIGLAEKKYTDFSYDESIYVIADEQDYHMKVLKLILQKLNKPYAERIKHLSYGLVELPNGRMKTREGTVVDADYLIDELVKVTAAKTDELGKAFNMPDNELKELHETIAIGALKFFLLRIDPRNRIIFNPEESIDFHGFTGPFIQYTHARIQSILRLEKIYPDESTDADLLPLEKKLILFLERFLDTVEQAASKANPSVLAVYVYNLARLYNSFYAAHSVRNAENDEKKQLRLKLSSMTARTIAESLKLLGIKAPERM